MNIEKLNLSEKQIHCIDVLENFTIKNKKFYYFFVTNFFIHHNMYYTKEQRKTQKLIVFSERRSRLCQKTEVVVVSDLEMTAAV